MDEKNPYVINLQTSTSDEMARLLLQDSILTMSQGGVLPPDRLAALQSGQRVLDLACGPGGWALELAHQRPDIQVVGIDVSQPMIQYAQAQAQVRGLTNSSFYVDNIHTFQLEEETFDLLHARLLLGVMTRSQWLPLWQKCRSFIKRGGWLCWMEGESPYTNSPAYEEFSYLLSQALFRSGQSLSVDGRHIGLYPEMTALLEQAGYTNREIRSYVIDGSAGTSRWQVNAQDALATFTLLKPFLVRIGVITASRFEELIEQMEEQIQQPTYHAIGVMLSVWGQA